MEILKEFSTILQEILINNFSSSMFRVHAGRSEKNRNASSGYSGPVWWLQRATTGRFLFWRYESWKTVGMVDLYQHMKPRLSHRALMGLEANPNSDEWKRYSEFVPGTHTVFIDCFEVRELKNIQTFAEALEKKLEEETADDHLKIKDIKLNA